MEPRVFYSVSEVLPVLQSLQSLWFCWSLVGLWFTVLIFSAPELWMMSHDDAHTTQNKAQPEANVTSRKTPSTCFHVLRERGPDGTVL